MQNTRIITLFLGTFVLFTLLVVMVQDCLGTKETTCETMEDQIRIRCFKQNAAADVLRVKNKAGDTGRLLISLFKYNCSKEAKKKKTASWNKVLKKDETIRIQFQSAPKFDDCIEAIISNCTLGQKDKVERPCNILFEVITGPEASTTTEKPPKSTIENC